MFAIAQWGIGSAIDMICDVGQVSQQHPEVERSTVLVDGARVHYRKSGSGPPLILVHGLVSSSRNWDQNVAHLAQFRTVYAPDLLNKGHSERVRGLDPGLPAEIERMTRWMDAVGIAAADVVGHSHGGAIAIVLAAMHPERVLRLALFAPANPYCMLGQPQVRFYSTFFGGVFARQIIPLLPRVLYRRSLERTYGDGSRVTPGILEGYTETLDKGAIGHIVAVMRGWDGDMALVENALGKLNGRPLLLAWGDRDVVVGIDSGRKLAERLGTRLVVIESAGHVPFEELPEITNALLEDWLLK